MYRFLAMFNVRFVHAVTSLVVLVIVTLVLISNPHGMVSVVASILRQQVSTTRDPFRASDCESLFGTPVNAGAIGHICDYETYT